MVIALFVNGNVMENPYKLQISLKQKNNCDYNFHDGRSDAEEDETVGSNQEEGGIN